ncbi:MAG: hypothetical protein C0593_12165 [Marinilabiliales bacterium]|nr:MAG: hypothetical protein C0593_12165 [Marinilabiliales bacterium]
MNSTMPINYHISELKEMENLSERTRNVCIADSIPTLYKIVEYYFKYGTFKDLRNCGAKTNTELIRISEKFIGQYNLTPEKIKIDPKFKQFEDFKIFCFNSFNIPTQDIETFRDDFFKNQFPFCKFLIAILQKNMNEREFFIFRQNFNYFTDSSKRTLQSIGDIYDVTRERVRQISQKIPSMMERIIAVFGRELTYIYDHIDYDLETKRDMIIINKKVAEKINQREDIIMTPKFFGTVFASFFDNDYSTFQNFEKTYDHYYLVKNDLFEKFDFSGAYAKMQDLLSVRIEETYPINIDDFLNPFAKTKDEKWIKRAKAVFRQVANEHLEVGISNDKKDFLLARNTLIKLSEHILDILTDVGRPMQLTEIHEELANRTDRVPRNIESLRSSILSLDEVAAIGKTSTYALAEWDNVKTATIKEMVREFLEKNNDPKHINDITEYVIKFRDTTSKNVLSNLKLDRTDTFAFFQKNYIGLVNKNYDKEWIRK